MASRRTFSLLGKGLKLDSAEDIAPHIQALKDDPDVEEVQFTGNTLGVGASEALASVLQMKSKLQVAKFDDIFTSRLLSEIPPALEALLQACLKLPLLHTVDLCDNAFGLNTQAPLVSFLAQHTPLEHLILNNNGLGPEAGTHIANALTELAGKKAKINGEGGKGAPVLKTVVCGRNRLETGSMEAWARCYAVNTGVQTVRMVQNGIRQEGVTVLLKHGLRHVKSLKVLDLQDNTFTAMGARALSDVIGEWTQLQELGVGDSLLGARGGVMLTDALMKGANGKLEVLKLQYDEVDAKTVKGIADAVEAGKLPNLRRVELNGNKFNEEDVHLKRLKEALDERRDKAGADAEDENWGIDELDELEEESEEEDEGEEEVEDEEEEKGDKVLEQADQAEEENVAEDKDKKVDELADLLGKTEIK